MFGHGARCCGEGGSAGWTDLGRDEPDPGAAGAAANEATQPAHGAGVGSGGEAGRTVSRDASPAEPGRSRDFGLSFTSGSEGACSRVHAESGVGGVVVFVSRRAGRWGWAS